jgi:hypothetical protein
MNVRNVLNEYDAKVAALLKDEERKVHSNGPYLGYSSCAECHPPFLESWKRTRHAGAFRSLEDVGKSRDPGALSAIQRVTERKAVFTAPPPPRLADVQCECHGGKALSDYAIPMSPVGEPVCLRCHTGENSPDFDFKTYLEKIRH